MLLEGVAIDLVSEESCLQAGGDVVVEVIDVEALAGLDAALGDDALEDDGVGLGDTEQERAETVVETLVHGVAHLARRAQDEIPMNVADVTQQIDVVVFAELLHELQTGDGNVDHGAVGIEDLLIGHVGAALRVHDLEELVAADVAEVHLVDHLEKGMSVLGESCQRLASAIKEIGGNGHTEVTETAQGTHQVDIEKHAAEVEEYVFE